MEDQECFITDPIVSTGCGGWVACRVLMEEWHALPHLFIHSTFVG